MPDLPLAGCRVVLTRPAAQAQSLATLIRAQGGDPVLFPLLEISPLDDYANFDHLINDLARFNWAIFVSMNAVNFGIPRVLQNSTGSAHPCPTHPWPAHLRCVGIGPSTAAALTNAGLTNILAPAHRFDSEGLLALPEMQHMEGQRVIIFRGQGGRDLIASTLRARGAEVSYAECYRRLNPQTDAGDLPRLWQNKQLQAIVITSSEALGNLLELAGGENQIADWLRATPLYVSHPRIGERARAHGLQVYVSDGPDDNAMLQCLISQAKPANREQNP